MIQAFLDRCVEIFTQEKDTLTKLDGIVGDGDLGLTMLDGFKAVSQANIPEDDIGIALFTIGRTMASTVPSTMGTLIASGFMEAGKQTKGKHDISYATFITALEAFSQGVMNRGHAKQGDKTFLDGFIPAIETFKSRTNESWADITHKAYMASVQGYENTATMKAVHGRAALRGDDSIGIYDAGAYVATLVFKSLI